MMKVMVYKYDTKFDDPNYESCDNETSTIYFHNLTNLDAFLAGDELPNFKQVGPYIYTSHLCKFNVTVEGNIEYSWQYRTEYVLSNEGDGVSENDLITTLNPGYNGLMRAFRSFNYDEPEYTFELFFFGGYLQGLLGIMQDPTYIESMLEASTPYLYRIMLR
jgi:hypothetical protein